MRSPSKRLAQKLQSCTKTTRSTTACGTKRTLGIPMIRLKSEASASMVFISRLYTGTAYPSITVAQCTALRILLPRKLAAEDEVDAAAGAVVEGVGKEAFEEGDAVGFEVRGPVVAGFD